MKTYQVLWKIWRENFLFDEVDLDSLREITREGWYSEEPIPSANTTVIITQSTVQNEFIDEATRRRFKELVEYKGTHQDARAQFERTIPENDLKLLKEPLGNGPMRFPVAPLARQTSVEPPTTLDTAPKMVQAFGCDCTTSDDARAKGCSCTPPLCRCKTLGPEYACGDCFVGGSPPADQSNVDELNDAVAKTRSKRKPAAKKAVKKKVITKRVRKKKD